MPWSCGCAGEPDLGIPVHDKAVVDRYRKIREHARRSEGNEKQNAKVLLRKLGDMHLLLAKQVAKLDRDEAVAKANEHVARAAASRAAAMGSGPASTTDQLAYWSGFIEETITYIADHPNEPAPSAVAFVETMDLGPEGRIFTSIKKVGVKALAAWADRQVANQVQTLRTMQRDLERGKLPRAVQQVVNRTTGKRSSKKKPSKLTPPSSRKRKKHMAEALLAELEEECDVAISESEDTDTHEELYEFELVVPKALWPRIKANPEVLVAFLAGALDEDAEDDDEPSDSGLALDEDDPFPNDDDAETPDDFDGDEDEDEVHR